MPVLGNFNPFSVEQPEPELGNKFFQLDILTQPDVDDEDPSYCLLYTSDAADE